MDGPSRPNDKLRAALIGLLTGALQTPPPQMQNEKAVKYVASHRMQSAPAAASGNADGETLVSKVRKRKVTFCSWFSRSISRVGQLC